METPRSEGANAGSALPSEILINERILLEEEREEKDSRRKLLWRAALPVVKL